MAHGSHIHHRNYEFIGAKGPAPMSTFSHGPDLHPGDLDPTVHAGTLSELSSWAASQSSPTQRGQYPHSSPAMARSPVQETKGPRLVTNSPREWPCPATSFLGNLTVNHTKGPAPTPAFSDPRWTYSQNSPRGCIPSRGSRANDRTPNKHR
jgi:hypothetical protein